MTSYAGPTASTLPLAGLIPAARGRHASLPGVRRIATLAWLALGGLVGLVVMPQVGTLRDSVGALAGVQPSWVGAAVALVVLRYAMAGLSLQLAVGRPIPFGPTMLVQVSSSFIGRLPPEGIGWLVLNQRYLEGAGLARSSAAAAIAVKVLAGGIARVVVMVAVGVLVVASGAIRPELAAVSGLVLAAVAGLVLAAVAGTVIVAAATSHAVARRLIARATAPVGSAARDLATVLGEPRRATALFGVSALLPISWALVLAASLAALEADVPLLLVVAVYLAGTAVASASPTPGNIGAVELALATGLTAVGVPPPQAVAAVLVYRLLTFWLPLLPGFLAFRYLQRGGYV